MTNLVEVRGRKFRADLIPQGSEFIRLKPIRFYNDAVGSFGNLEGITGSQTQAISDLTRESDLPLTGHLNNHALPF